MSETSEEQARIAEYERRMTCPSCGRYGDGCVCKSADYNAAANEIERLRRVEEAARAFLADERYVPGYPAELRLRKALGLDKQEPRT